MKNKLFKTGAAVCVILCALLCAASCSDKQDTSLDDSQPQANIQLDSYQEKIAYCMEQIATLEEQLASEKESNYINKNNYELQISALETTISQLKAQLNAQSTTSTPNNSATQTPDSSQTQPSQLENAQFKYIKDNDGITITKYIGTSTDITIPDKIDGLPVLAVGENAFATSSVKRVVIPEGVKMIDWFAFSSCTQLTEIKLPASLSSIQYGAFDNVKPSFIIICPKGSFAEAYAKSWGYICVAE